MLAKGTDNCDSLWLVDIGHALRGVWGRLYLSKSVAVATACIELTVALETVRRYRAAQTYHTY